MIRILTIRLYAIFPGAYHRPTPRGVPILQVTKGSLSRQVRTGPAARGGQGPCRSMPQAQDKTNFRTQGASHTRAFDHDRGRILTPRHHCHHAPPDQLQT